MLRRSILKGIVLLFFLLVSLYGETSACDIPSISMRLDTIVKEISTEKREETKVYRVPKIREGAVNRSKVNKPHSPHKATIMAMLLPGSAQIYNKQIWKLPILYAGAGGIVYGLSWNNKIYTKYRKAFVGYVKYVEEWKKDETIPYPSENSWDKVLVPGRTAENFNKDWFQNILMNKKNNYKRDRDLMIILAGGLYVLQIIDAVVFAHFYDYDINEDLSLNFQPTSKYLTGAGHDFGFSLTLTF